MRGGEDEGRGGRGEGRALGGLASGQADASGKLESPRGLLMVRR